MVAAAGATLVALSAVAYAQSAAAADCKKTETQAECHARLKCKPNEELEDCQRRLLKCNPGEQLEACKGRIAKGGNAGQSGDNAQRGDQGGGNDRGDDRGRDDRGRDDRGRDDRGDDRGRDDRGDDRGRGDNGYREDRGGGASGDRGRRRRGGGGGGGDRRGREGGGRSDFVANKTFGLGVEGGEPTGLNGKYFLSDSGAFDFGVGWVYRHYYYGDGIHLYGDYLWHPMSLVSAQAFELPFYIGVGLRFWDFDYCRGPRDCGYGGSAVGIRVPFGIAFDFNEVPLDIFIQLIPVLDFVRGDYYDFYDDRAHFGIDLSAGIRYWFK
jgi:hypothetical protein